MNSSNRMDLKYGIRVDVKGQLPFRARVFGGPFVNFDVEERRLVGVKMAAEIDHPHNISIPTQDFSVPEPDIMLEGMIKAIRAMREGNDLYVGCMGGVGRTGLFMAILVKACLVNAGEYGDPIAPILHVRSYYNPHAVETVGQREYVQNFDVTPLLRYISGEYLVVYKEYVPSTPEVISEMNYGIYDRIKIFLYNLTK